jgi:monoamine oxidase
LTPSRRDFIKYVVAGSVLAGCPIDETLLAAPAPAPKLEGEQNEICHQLRDGQKFERPPVSRRCDIAIVGGGVSGLSAAYFLQKYEFVLLEKEPHWGGNAYLEEFEGQAYGTGSAYESAGSAGAQLSAEIGLPPLPVACPDPTIVHGVWVPDTWRSGIDHLPYPRSVRESFKKFRDAMLKVDVKSGLQELDSQPFTRYTEGHAPEIARWWDGYGPSNWGARTKDTSAYVGIEAVQSVGDEEPDRRVTWPGGLGAITRRLSELLIERHGEKMLAGATTISVEPQKDDVHVRYAHGGKVETIAAKAVIMATPKYITRRLVAGIPDAQDAAMKKLRYAPYPVVNLMFDRPVYRRGYDTWCPGSTFTDFIVADWTIRNQPGYKPKYNILSCYTPLQEFERARLLTDEESRLLAAAVLRDFQKLLPGFHVDPVEVHIYRRGHPMFMATPGTYTVTIPAARPPLERVFFSNADSEGPESTTSGGIRASRRGAEWAEKLLAGAPRAALLRAALLE